jgi:hypothetical protein
MTAEEKWCAECRRQVRRYLAGESVQHGRIGSWPAWHVAPYVSVWAIESRARPGCVGWWAICGDVPTDYESAARISIHVPHSGRLPSAGSQPPTVCGADAHIQHSASAHGPTGPRLNPCSAPELGYSSDLRTTRRRGDMLSNKPFERPGMNVSRRAEDVSAGRSTPVR